MSSKGDFLSDIILLMIVATWNINSIKMRMKILTSWLRKVEPDFLCLQETKVRDEEFPKEELKRVGYNSVFSGEGGRNGVSILSKDEPDFESAGFLDGEEDNEKRLISAKFRDLTIVSVYVPLGGSVGSERFKYKMRFFNRLRMYFNRFHKPDEKIILCGDFNVVLTDMDVYDEMDLIGEIGLLPEEREKLKEFLSWGFYDTFRYKNPDKKEFSFWDYRRNAFKKNKGMRIDYIFVTEPLIKVLIDSYIDVEPRELEKPSDHTPVVSIFKD